MHRNEQIECAYWQAPENIETSKKNLKLQGWLKFGLNFDLKESLVDKIIVKQANMSWPAALNIRVLIVIERGFRICN